MIFRTNNILKKMKNRYQGQDVVLVGCGPSILSYDIKQPAYYAAVNRAFLYPKIKFDFIFAQDDLRQEMSAAAKYRWCLCRKFFGWIDSQLYQEKWVQDLHICPIPKKYFYYPRVFQYQTTPKEFEKNLDFSCVADCGGTALSACQILLYMGFKRLFLVGFDNTFENHFYGGNTEDFSKQIVFWEKFKDFSAKAYPDAEIISVNPIGLKGLFCDVYTQDYINKHSELKEQSVEILEE